MEVSLINSEDAAPAENFFVDGPLSATPGLQATPLSLFPPTRAELLLPPLVADDELSQHLFQIWPVTGTHVGFW